MEPYSGLMALGKDDVTYWNYMQPYSGLMALGTIAIDFSSNPCVIKASN
jgi:hypothetical protein